MSKNYRSVVLIAFVILAFGTAYGADSPATGPFHPVSNPGNPPGLLDWGGPDAFGYYYIDSRDTAYNAPVYNWQEISGFGVDVGFNDDDQNLGPFLIGFTFSFYGVDFVSFRASTNGFASFSSTATAYSNVAIPNTLEPNNLLAVYWDDLDARFGGHTYYYTNNSDSLIIQWDDFPLYDGSGYATFEIILTANGNIVYQYESLTGTHNSHTIGIENQGGTIGLQYVYNTERDETGTAILFTTTRPDFGNIRVLVVAADAATTYISELQGFSNIGQVDYFDARNGTPTLGDLQNYDVAVVWSNYGFNDRVAMGDVLADYLDAGGGVVLHEFCFYGGWALQGRIMSDYSPFAPGTTYADRSLGAYDAGHPLMAGVSTLTDTYGADVTLVHSPVLVASYADGTPLAAYDPSRRLVAINGYVGNNRTFSGDLVTLSHNAIGFVKEGPAEILMLYSDPYGSGVARRALKAYPDVQSIHIYNAYLSTPALSLLQLYDAVVVWSNSQFSDSPTLGNRLADYEDLGGGVVLALFSFGSGWELQGRVMASYSPFGAGTIRFETHSLGVYNPSHYLMQGVTAVTDFFTVAVSVQNGGVNVASWDDSTPFVAYNPVNGLVGINGYIGGAQQYTGDMMVIVHNAINFARWFTDVDDEPTTPAVFELSQNYPNPFNPTTTIAFDLPKKSDVTLEIFNVLGQRIAELPQGSLAAGHHSVTVDASQVSSGVYFYRLTAGDLVKTKKMVIMK